jgi:hypothetical protein
MKAGRRRRLAVVALIGITIAVALVATRPAAAQSQWNESGVDISVRAGQEFTHSVGTFEDPGGGSSSADFTATILWGDGRTAEAGTIVEAPTCGRGARCYEVRGTHSYASAGSFGLVVTVSEAGGPDLFVVRPTATVRQYDGVDVAATAGAQFAGAVAGFRDPGGTSAADFSATISWGDGSAPTPGTIVQLPACPGGADLICYEVHGTHSYAAAGSFALGVTVNGPGTSEAVTSTASVAPATSPPTPGPPSEPGAKIALAQPAVKPGGLAILDASGSTGPIAYYAFDVNGNGTFETKCEVPYAGAVHTTTGAKHVGVKVVGADGKASTAAVTLSVAGQPQAPPAGKLGLKSGTLVGGCLAGKPSTSEELLAATAEQWSCPATVQVGVAEATIPQVTHLPPLTGDPCFKRESKPGNPDYPRFVAGQELVNLNGIEIDTRPINAANNNLVVYEGPKYVTQVHPGFLTVVMRLRREGVGHLTSAPFKFGTWHVGKPGVVGHFPIEGFFEPNMLGLPVVAKDVPITFTTALEAKTQVFVVPPFSFSSLGAGNSPTGQPLNLVADNTDGLRVEGGSIVAGGGGTYKLDLPLGIFHLTGTLHYSNEAGSNVWSGNVNLRIPDTPVDKISGFVKFRDGNLEQAHVSSPFAGSGLGPVFCCFYLVQLDGTLTPSSINATATFAAGPKLWQDFRAAQAKASMTIHYTPFVLAFVADQLKIMNWTVKANTAVVITPNKLLANAFWGPVDFGPITDYRVNVLAQVGNPWVIAGGGTACFEVFVPIGCVNINAAAGPNGITACGGVKVAGETIAGGVRIPWNPLKFWSWSGYWGCSFGLVQAKVSAAAASRARAAGAGADYAVEVPRGLRTALIVIKGSGAKPRVRLRGPDGTVITTPAAGQDNVRGESWLAIRDTNDDSVHVVVARPAAGSWTVSEVAGSPAVRSIALAEPLPTRFAAGTVTGAGRTRTLRYRVNRAPGTEVRFFERGGRLPAAGGGAVDPRQIVDREIGTARGSRGAIRFAPAEAMVRARRIEAVVFSQGAAIKTEKVATFTAPPGRPPAPRVSVARDGGALRVRWSEVAAARIYRVAVNRSNGRTDLLTRPAGKRALTVRGVNRLTAARVEVRAVSEAGYVGMPGRARLSELSLIDVPRKLSASEALRRGALTVLCTAGGDGPCEVAVADGGRTLARGERRIRYSRTEPVTIKLTAAGRKALLGAIRSGRDLGARVTATVPGAVSPSRRVTFR